MQRKNSNSGRHSQASNGRNDNRTAEQTRVEEAFERRISTLNDEFKTKDFETRFNVFIGFIVLLNAVVIAIDTDRNQVDPATISENETLTWVVVNNTFAVIFCIELFIRVYRERWAYPKSAWNWLDIICVGTTSVDLWILPLVSGDGGLPSLSVLRVLRLLRLIRLLRIFRMFEGMYVLIVAFAMSLQSMAWLTVLIVLGIFLCAIFLTQLVGHDKGYEDLAWGRGSRQELFGTVGKSMYTLFELLTLENWNDIGRPLVMKNGLFMVFFIVFFMLFSFGLMNMIVGLVVEKTIHQSQNSEANKMKEKNLESKNAIKDLRRVYLEMDGNEDGVLSLEEMEQSVDKPTVVQVLERLGVHVEQIKDLFDILDVDQSQTVDVEEFIEGMTKLKGKFRTRDFIATQMSVTTIESNQSRLFKKIRSIRQNDQKIHKVITRLEDLLSKRYSKPINGCSKLLDPENCVKDAWQPLPVPGTGETKH